MAAEAAGMSRITWYRIEKGEPAVTMGAWMNAVTVVGLALDAMTSEEAQLIDDLRKAFGHAKGRFMETHSSLEKSSLKVDLGKNDSLSRHKLIPILGPKAVNTIKLRQIVTHQYRPVCHGSSSDQTIKGSDGCALFLKTELDTGIRPRSK